ncbi:hypothetical protein V8C43DRAFT_267582 [Trichoderma afarasin]
MRKEDLNLLIELLLTKFLLTGLLFNKLWLLRGHRDIGSQLASPLPLRFGSSQAQLGPGWVKSCRRINAGISNPYHTITRNTSWHAKTKKRPTR